MPSSLLVAVFALILAGLGLWQVYRLRSRFNLSLGSGSNQPLEEQLAVNLEKNEEIKQKLQHLTREYERISDLVALASQKISVVRFNPFGDTGGDQSFALAVLDAQNSGYVLTSIHGRQGTRVYIKPVDFGQSKYQLSSEEQKVLGQAIKRTPDKVSDG